MLKVCKLTCERNEQILFSELTFELKPGSWAWIQGANGSGKSTLLKALAGLLLPLVGQIFWENKVINPSYDSDYANQRLFLGHKTGVSLHLTPAEALSTLYRLSGPINAVANGTSQGGLDRLDQTLQILHMNTLKNTLCEKLSPGQRQRIALAILWLTAKKLWILDEPLTGLDTDLQTLFFQRLNIHFEAGGLAVIASHSEIQSLPRAIKIQLADWRENSAC